MILKIWNKTLKQKNNHHHQKTEWHVGDLIKKLSLKQAKSSNKHATLQN